MIDRMAIEQELTRAGYDIVQLDDESVRARKSGVDTTVRFDRLGDRSVVQAVEKNIARHLELAAGRPVVMMENRKSYGIPLNSEPCATCGASLGDAVGNIAHGVWGALTYFSGLGAAGKDLIESRIEICQQCQAVDTNGERLMRIEGDVPYCGAPLLRKAARDQAKDGCGCPLKKKTAVKAEKCPIGRW